jgi:hypothetical protein
MTVSECNVTASRLQLRQYQSVPLEAGGTPAIQGAALFESLKTVESVVSPIGWVLTRGKTMCLASKARYYGRIWGMSSCLNERTAVLAAVALHYLWEFENEHT